ncbi:helix-turn-helix domain-containing protein [Amycolatopsis sp. NPDC059657]|uniref:helix-turn-helix domain-containing protein n=1 Tax=Amycolatopsis sp. NPDC059657 TaxID=3346899 RepID=UPI00366F7BFD
MNASPKTQTQEPVGDVPERKAYVPAEASVLLGGIGYRAVMRLIHLGRLGHIKEGRAYLIPLAEIERYLKPAIKDQGEPRAAMRTGANLRSA